MTTGLVGLAAGMGVNVLSTDAGYRGVAAAFAAAGTLAGANWLRRLPRQAPLVRWTSRLLLTLALFAAVVSAALAAAGWSARWSAYAALAAAALVLTVVLLATEQDAAVDLLAGVAFIGVGIVIAGLGLSLLLDHQNLAGVGGIGVGIAAAGDGLSLLLDHQNLAGVAFIGGGIAVAGYGLSDLRSTGWLAQVRGRLVSLTREPPRAEHLPPNRTDQ